MKKALIAYGEKSGEVAVSYILSFIKDEYEIFYLFNEQELIGFKGIEGEIAKSLQYIRVLKEKIDRINPHIVILTGLNDLHLLASLFLKKHRARFIFLGMPQIWAWGKWRYRILRKVRCVLTFFPFEELLGRRLGIKTLFIGHPALQFIKSASKINERMYIGFFPGTRKKEIKKHAPLLLSVIEHLKKAGIDEILWFGENAPMDIKSVKYEDRYRVMDSLYLAFASAGTVTLELGLKAIPSFIFYKLSKVDSILLPFIVHIKNISLPAVLGAKSYEKINPLTEDFMNFYFSFKSKREDFEKTALLTQKQLLKMLDIREGTKEQLLKTIK